MGGNAMSTFGIETCRLGHTQYQRLIDHLLPRLREALPQLRLDTLPHIREKSDFGDLDLVASVRPEAAISHSDWQELHQALMQMIGATARYSNGDVTSFDADCALLGIGEHKFQVDLIRIPAACHDFAVNYFSHNDLGNLVGLLARKFGVKLGQFGLLLPLRPEHDPNYLFQEVVLTRDYRQALRWLGFDPTRPSLGFDTFDDLYRFVLSSPYSDNAIYQWSNRNAKGRVRDKKRATYNRFLRWLDDHPLARFDWDSQGALARKTFWAAVAADAPDAIERIAEAKRQMLFNIEVKKRYNGARVSRLTGHTAQALGTTMAAIRGSFPTEADYLAWAYQATDADILHRHRHILTNAQRENYQP